MTAIGVTGHRFLAEIDKLAASVDEALAKVQQAFPGQPMVVISSLAEGADRLVAHRVLMGFQGRLVVPLPLPQADYMKDFPSAQSQQEFLNLLRQADEVVELPPTANRDAAYEAAGRYVLDRCDALMALWDGQGAQGQGGTGEMVALARQRGLPLIWINAGNRKPGTQEPTSLGEEQGKITFEGFDRFILGCSP